MHIDVNFCFKLSEHETVLHAKVAQFTGLYLSMWNVCAGHSKDRWDYFRLHVSYFWTPRWQWHAVPFGLNSLFGLYA